MNKNIHLDYPANLIREFGLYALNGLLVVCVVVVVFSLLFYRKSRGS